MSATVADELSTVQYCYKAYSMYGFRVKYEYHVFVYNITYNL